MKATTAGASRPARSADPSSTERTGLRLAPHTHPPTAHDTPTLVHPSHEFPTHELARGPRAPRPVSRSRRALRVAARTALLLVGFSLAPAHVGAQDACLTDEVAPLGLTGSNLYGFSIARSGPFLAVGAPGYPALAPAAGGVFVYERVGAFWNPSSILLPSGLAAGDNAGASLALQGNTLVVGLRRDDAPALDSGSVRVYEHSGLGWLEVATLVDPDGASLDEFGSSVALDGDVIVVGSPYDANDVGDETGSACIFRRVAGTWQFEQKVIATFGEHGDAFGSAVAIAGEWIAIGAPEDNGPAGIDSGSVTVFRDLGTTWSEFAFLEAGLPAAGDFFGTALAMTNDLLLVGAPYASTTLVEAGMVIPFRRDGVDWLEDATVTSPTPAANHYFGSSIAIRGSEVAIGEPFAIIAGQFASGAAHLFIDSGSALGAVATVSDPTPTSGSLVGTTVAVEGGELVTGAILDGTNGFGSGLVHRFVVGGDDCDGSGVPDLCEIAAETVIDCDGNGVPDSCDLASGRGEDCDGNGNLDACDLAGGAEDCDRNGILDSCELARGDCNANGLLDACEPDCNDNGVPDDCDIDLGLVPDCDGNGNPDDCDIAFGLATDCNGNGIPDSCDLVRGVETDCNENGVADTCDVLFGTSPDLDGDGYPDECGPRFIRGDVNGDRAVDLADAIALLSYVTTVGVMPPCAVSADANGDADLDVADGAYLISYLSTGGPPPPLPFPDCGWEPDVSGLDCEDRPDCN